MPDCTWDEKAWAEKFARDQLCPEGRATTVLVHQDTFYYHENNDHGYCLKCDAFHEESVEGRARDVMCPRCKGPYIFGLSLIEFEWTGLGD